MTNSSDNRPSRLTTLDVLGVGLSVEMFQQAQVWEEIRKNQNRSILPTDPKAYLTTMEAKIEAIERRSAKALGAAAKSFIAQWPIPGVCIWPGRDSANETADVQEARSKYFAGRIESLRESAEIPQHEFTSLGAFCHNEPEEVLERAFQFFDGYPDVPAILLFATDGDMTRLNTGDMSRHLHWKDGPRRFDSMSETVVALLLARRERVDALRPFAARRETHTHAAGPIPDGFKPKKFLPQPWTIEQIQQFDALPTAAQLHRPVRVSYRKDKDGKPTFDAGKQVSTMYAQERQSAFKAGFDDALRGTENSKPARIFYDTGGPTGGRNLIPLAQAVDDSLPDFDLFQPGMGIDLHACVGNTGAASPLVQWALSVFATFESRKASLSVNLRQQDEATITAVTPRVVQARASARVATSSAAATPVSGAETAGARNTPLGARFPSGAQCPQSGIWQCDQNNAKAGKTHFIPAGRVFPRMEIPVELSAWQKVRGDVDHQIVPVTWTLQSYDQQVA